MRRGAVRIPSAPRTRLPLAMGCCDASAVVGPAQALIEHAPDCPVLVDPGSSLSETVKRQVEEQAGPYLASRGLRMAGLTQLSPRVWVLRWRLR